MKLKLIIVVGLLTLATSSFAQFFPARMNVMVLPGQVSAEVFNPYYEPIICSGQVFGQVAQGQVLTAFFFEQIIPAGGFSFAFVRTTPFAPFVGGWANIGCRFARRF